MKNDDGLFDLVSILYIPTISFTRTKTILIVLSVEIEILQLREGFEPLKPFHEYDPGL